MKNIVSMLPFLDTESKDELVENILNNNIEDIHTLIPSIYPFLNKEQLNKLFQASLHQKINIDPYLMLPFLDTETLEALIESHQDDKDLLDIERLMPFLNNKSINTLFKAALKDLKKTSN